MKNLLCRFSRDDRGNVAIIFGMAIIPFMIAAGMAIDYGRAVVAKQKMQAAVDAAVLAAASMSSAAPADRKALGKAIFEANYPPSEYGLNVGDDFIQINDNVVSANETHKINTSLMRLASKTDPLENLGYKAKATALVPQIGGAEIALVLDYSGSMGGYLNGTPKYVTMRNAAKDLILDVTSNGENEKVKIAMVPFSSGVRARLKREHTVSATTTTTTVSSGKKKKKKKKKVTVTTIDAPSGTNRAFYCVGDRRINATNDSEPSTGAADWRHRWWVNDVWYDRYSSSEGYWDHRSTSCNSNHQVYELSNQISNITNSGNGYLSRWSPSGMTAISAGFSMGWHAISPNSVLEGGSSYDLITADDPEDRIIKAIVLLTDGAQTAAAVRSTSDSGVGENINIDGYYESAWRHSPENAQRNLEEACTNAKALGVIVVTVAFDLDDEDTVERLENCASDAPGGGKMSYDAGSNAELLAAFSEIGSTLTQMVYLSK